MPNFRVLDQNEIEAISGGEAPRMTEGDSALRQLLSGLSTSERMGVLSAAATPDPLGPGFTLPGGGEIIVEGARPGIDQGFGIQGPLLASLQIVLELMRDANEEDLQYYLELLGIGQFDAQFLDNWVTAGGAAGSPTQSSTTHNCEGGALQSTIANVGIAIAMDGLKDNSNKQREYSSITVERNGLFIVGPTTPGQSYSESNPPGVKLQLPDGYNWSEVSSIYHNHPTSGFGSAADAKNIRPSDGDWLAFDKITGNDPKTTLPSYADGSQLKIYIEDSNGVIRVFDYKTPTERGASVGKAGNQSTASGIVVTPGGDGGC